MFFFIESHARAINNSRMEGEGIKIGLDCGME